MQTNHLHKILSNSLPEDQILSRPIDRYGFAADASFYRLIPETVVQPKTEDDIRNLFRIALETWQPIVFRAAGTSLSGQSITDGILVDISRYWREHEILDGGEGIRLQPGVIGAHANMHLRPLGRKIGPDPASINACMIGGIIANNASGMCCGVRHNSYHTLEDIRFILPNGHCYDSRDVEAAEAFRNTESELAATLGSLRDRIRSNPELLAKVRGKYRRKNTTGYSLNAFVDFDDPFDIFCHLLVGSEGTLAFISDVTLRTLPDYPEKATALTVFQSLEEAVNSVGPLQEMGAEAVELMDRASLRSVENQSGVPQEIRGVSETAAALLVEFQAETQQKLAEFINEGEEWISGQMLELSTGFSTEQNYRDRLWKVRKGLYPSVGAVRKAGTSVIIEDIAFPGGGLAAATQKVRRLLDANGYEDGIIFGHAKDGNLHFVIAQDFDREGTTRYENLLNDIAELVVEYGGSLKAEHGTGRNMAPFVEAEWGPELYNIMHRLKQAVDPENILNPGVILNENPRVHLQDIKSMPEVDPIVDQCVECGFCEPACPSRDLTTTPRRRIVIQREIARLSTGSSEEQAVAKSLEQDYLYEGVDTCAADGLCGTACPVDIDTGRLMKDLRRESKSPIQRRCAGMVERNFGTVTRLIRFGLSVAVEIQGVIGQKRWLRMWERFNRWSSGAIPAWNRYIPVGYRGALSPSNGETEKPRVVYFPSCLTRTAGNFPGERSDKSVDDSFARVLQRAGISYIVPPNVADLCCGQPWNSKGYIGAYKTMAERTMNSLWSASRGGTIPVVCDTSPCSHSLMQYSKILKGKFLERWKKLYFRDIVEFLHSEILPKLHVRKVPGLSVIHPTCSTEKMGQTDLMKSIAEQCTEQAIIPEHHGCCGFAGDRGLLYPELTNSATTGESKEVRNLEKVSGYYSSSRTCEIGMSDAVGKPYRSIVYLVEEASRKI
ncbi:MAG: FAD-binding oxidoreductase [Candidatus Marinimicrobia bacterium]|nr:FAD-binding oxidoreductase [Candidatus Neomarinimicrobiota bacterium]MCF7830041.1 FAD-binding oxidoreductase [Candidatus Neomarinimicrobiota bacterium]MCF7881919.1 FAD-binding oxidoreductase [Candidatus Neomarinimicrobiota bacterium]